MVISPHIKIALVDDHTLFRKGLISLVEMLSDNTEILFEADNGLEMQQKLDADNLPEIILMDINMPGMDGFESVIWLKKKYPTIKVLVISMVEQEESIIKMLKLGVKGYLCKDVEPQELKNALNAIRSKGFYYTDFITGKLVHTIQTEAENLLTEAEICMNVKEKKFMELICTEFSFIEIAKEMFMSPRTIEGYKYAMMQKVDVKSRVGLALYAVKHGIVKL